MYGKRQIKACPTCTAWRDGANGVAHHLAQNLDFAVVAAADVPSTRAHARKRGWDKREWVEIDREFPLLPDNCELDLARATKSYTSNISQMGDASMKANVELWLHQRILMEDSPCAAFNLHYFSARLP